MIPIFVDDKGCEVSISQGIGGPNGDWLVCRRQNYSYKRIKSIPPVPVQHKDLAIKALEAYAAKKKWRFKEMREEL